LLEKSPFGPILYRFSGIYYHLNTQLNVYLVSQNQNTVFLVFQTKNKVHDLPCPKIKVLDKQQMKRTRQ
jgi:hypothetical protein